MKLRNVVGAIVTVEKITDKDMKNTIIFLAEHIGDVRVLKQVAKELDELVAYEEAWV